MADQDRIDTETQAKLLERLANAFRERESLSDEGRGIEMTLLDAAKRLRELENENRRLVEAMNRVLEEVRDNDLDLSFSAIALIKNAIIDDTRNNQPPTRATNDQGKEASKDV